jgi:hypothetical protein
MPMLQYHSALKGLSIQPRSLFLGYLHVIFLATSAGEGTVYVSGGAGTDSMAGSAEGQVLH